MSPKATRSVTALTALLLLCGCTAPGIKAPSGESAPTVETLVKSVRSWDGHLLPAYPEGQPEITLLRITNPSGT